MMNAIQFPVYGDSNVLKFIQVEKPQAGDNEILVKIAATTVNPFDILIRSGKMREHIPISLPSIPGTDLSGTVEQIGRNVTRFKTGDRIFATTFGGTYAAYGVVNENQAALIPFNVNFEEAAALAIPLVTAYSFLVTGAGLQTGQRLFINGAAGGVGHIMVQMAKALGAYVIATASGNGIRLARLDGADEVLDYKRQDISKLVKDVDCVIDLVGGKAQEDAFSMIKAGGKLLSAVMPPSAELAEQFQVEAQFISSEPAYHKLDYGGKLVEDGRIRIRIARTMPLAEAAAAQDLVSGGGLNGKVVLAGG